MDLVFSNISFGYNEALINNLSCHFSKGWTGIIGPNGSGKTTLLLLAAGILKPDSGKIEGNTTAVYCQQRTDSLPDNFKNFLSSYDSISSKLKGKLNIMEEWVQRWNTLSHGERKRAQIGVALWQNPQLLIMDEPTNHLDLEAKTIIKDALSTYQGTGLLVSHDRELLNELPYQCLFLEKSNSIMRPGIYSNGLSQQKIEEDFSKEQKSILQNKIKKIKATANIKRNMSSQADKKRSKKGISHKDHDAKSKKDLARLTGKDAVQGKLLKQLDGRIKQEEDKLNKINVNKKRKLNYILPVSTSKNKFILHIDKNKIKIGNKELSFESLTIRPGERIAITGSNGSGKTTLINYLIHNLKTKKILYLQQEINKDESIEFKKQILNMPDKIKGKILTVISSLGSDPKKLLATSLPSPGELRKLMLAKGILDEPDIIIMDEPTNHMDLPSVECLENTLKECPAALLLVSHDKYFLESITEKEWSIIQDKKDINKLFLNKIS